MMMEPATAASPVEEEEEVEEEEVDDEEGEDIHVTFQNIVATLNFGIQLDLQKIQSSAKNAEYNPKRFQAVIMRIQQPRTTALIFASGKIIVTGAKSKSSSLEATKKFATIINKVGFPEARFHETNYRIQNMTATCDFGFPIRLEGFLYAYSTNCTYEPELFPGLIYRMVDPKVVLLIFVSGKVVVTGAKNEKDVGSAIDSIHKLLKDFRKTNTVVKGRTG